MPHECKIEKSEKKRNRKRWGVALVKKTREVSKTNLNAGSYQGGDG